MRARSVPRAKVAVAVFAVLSAASVARGQERTEDEVAPPPDTEPSDATVDLADAEARALFEAGSVAFEAGDFERALEHFSRAYELSQRPRLLYNVGLAADRLRHDQQALDAFERYLDAEPNSPHRDTVEPRIHALREAIAAHEREEQQAAAARLALEQRVDEAEHQSVFSRWWFWTIVGVVAVAAAATVIVVLSIDPGVQDPIPGTQGAVAAALRF